MKKRRIFSVFLVFIFFGGIIFFESKGYFERKHFYECQFNSLIVEIKNNWTGGRSYDYITNDNVVITLVNKNHTYELNITDSVVKEKNSWEFAVYKKEEGGKYTFEKYCNTMK